MRTLGWLALFTASACNVGGDDKKGDEHADAPVPEVTGEITADTTWSGQKRFEGVTVIRANVTVTVSEGAELFFGQNAGITVEQGAALVIRGSSASKVIGKFDAGATNWGPINVFGYFE